MPRAFPPVPWVSAASFEARFRELCDAEHRRFHRQGCDTARAVYVVLKRWHEAKGQGFEVTNENVSRALQALNRPHSRRTAQYTRQRLERMQLLQCAHVKRSGPRRIKGQMDTIRVHLLRRSAKHCTPPLRGTTKRGFAPELGGGAARKEEETPTFTASAPPASPADDPAAAAAEHDATMGGRSEAPGGSVHRLPPVMWGPGTRPSDTDTFSWDGSTQSADDRLRAAQARLFELQAAQPVVSLAEARRLRCR